MYTWGYLKDVSLSKLDLDEQEANIQNLINRFPFYANEVITQVCSTIKPRRDFAKFEVSDSDIGEPLSMPSDFVSFGDDVCYEKLSKVDKVELHDSDFEYYGYNKVVFKRSGTFYISYNARWITFDRSMDDNTLIDVPLDILDCIPSYIASQCYKIDDEYKAQVYRNEYEILFSRIDDANYRNTKTLYIEGDW